MIGSYTDTGEAFAILLDLNHAGLIDRSNLLAAILAAAKAAEHSGNEIQPRADARRKAGPDGSAINGTDPES